MSTKQGRYGNPRRRRLALDGLAKEVQPNGVADPRRLGGAISGPGGPRDRGAVVLDTTDCVLMQALNVCTVDALRNGQDPAPAVFMTLDGRVNNTRDQVRVGFMFGSDGAAALITELLAIADRFGPELFGDLVDRLTRLHRDGNLDLTYLRASVDNAIAAAAADG